MWKQSKGNNSSLSCNDKQQPSSGKEIRYNKENQLDLLGYNQLRNNKGAIPSNIKHRTIYNSSSIACNNKQQTGSNKEARNGCSTVQAQPDWQPQSEEQPEITPNQEDQWCEHRNAIFTVDYANGDDIRTLNCGHCNTGEAALNDQIAHSLLGLVQDHHRIPTSWSTPLNDLDLEEFCEKHYEKLLPIMADKYEYEQRKKEKLEEVKARLDFGEARKKSTRAQESAYSESRQCRQEDRDALAARATILASSLG
ncbi:hypothetical protein Tco_0713605 [Tanacetum coccineum]